MCVWLGLFAELRGHLMRSAYALIPAALLAGNVLFASPETKASRVEDVSAHTKRWNARQEYFKSRAKIRLAKAQSRKSWNRASAKPRQLAPREADPALKMASIGWM